MNSNFQASVPPGDVRVPPERGNGHRICFVREDVRVGFPGDRSTGKPGLRTTRVTSAWGRPCFSLTCRRCREQEFMPYGIATVRLYVGSVKRVALPIVSQAINLQDAYGFPQG